jgi:hypothetical protein
MTPDRSNYEIWFTEWLDGNLNEEQVEEFMVFLKDNPDLREELDGLADVSLEPPYVIFNGKNNLKKSFENLSESQFEHLCIESLENDLTSLQKSELSEIIDRDENKRKRFELFQKLKLKPSPGSFRRKSSVKRLTAGQKAIRVSVIGLSAAATVAVLVIAFLSFPANVNKETRQAVQNIGQDTFQIELAPAVLIEKTAPHIVQSNLSSEVDNTIPETGISKLPVVSAELINHDIPDSNLYIQRTEAITMVKVEIPDNTLTTYLASANFIQDWDPGFIPPLIDERSNVQRFLARFFREKIMRDKNSGNRPVESYEIASAGITGLNKLFGWEMALHKNTDGNGEVRSYYFTSKLLKFNTPVKKTINAL